MSQELKIIDDDQIVKIPLVRRYMSEIPTKITYERKDFDVRELLLAIGKLFYKKGVSVSTNEIVGQFGLEKADKFTYYMTKKMKNLMEKEIKYGRYYFYPKGAILITKSRDILDTTIYFKDDLQNISEMIDVNICNPRIILCDLLKLFDPKDITEIVNILVDIAKSGQSDIPQNSLIEKISSKLLEINVNDRTKECFYRIGNLKLPFILWLGTGKRGDEFYYDNIICKHKDVTYQQLADNILEKKLIEKKEIAKEQGRVFDNHPGYKLTRINLSRDISTIEKDRKLNVYLSFIPTDFFACIKTNMSIDELILDDNTTSIRKKFIRDQNLGDPIYLQDSRLSDMFGVALATITEDNQILLQKRSQHVSIGPSKLTLATAEHMIRGLDEDEYGNPNIFITTKRCLKEEIGIDIDFKDVKFLGFGIRLDNLLPQALGMVRLKLKSSDITFIKARDRWEGFNFAEEFSYEALEKYFKERYVISATAKLTILLALINQYGFEHIEEKAKTVSEQIIANI